MEGEAFSQRKGKLKNISMLLRLPSPLRGTRLNVAKLLEHTMSARFGISIALLIAVQTSGIAQQATSPQEDYTKWELLKPEFESTGGGGIIIRGYSPVVSEKVCRTNFTATEPNGTVYKNSVEFDASPVQGGILCSNGKWRADDGSATGTTPLRVFIKDGVAKRSP